MCFFFPGEGAQERVAAGDQVGDLGAGPPSDHGSHWKREPLAETAKLPFIRAFKDKFVNIPFI